MTTLYEHAHFDLRPNLGIVDVTPETYPDLEQVKAIRAYLEAGKHHER